MEDAETDVRRRTFEKKEKEKCNWKQVKSSQGRHVKIGRQLAREWE